MVITTKAQYFDLWHRGKLGNKFRTWRSLEELESSGYNGLCSIRYLDPSWPFAKYGVPAKDVGNECLKLILYGVDRTVRTDPKKLIFNEAAPDELLTIQGEIIELPIGLCLYYSALPDRMRIALAKDGKQLIGLSAKMMLEKYLDPNSLEDIRILLDRYSGHGIEFSTYSICVGDISHRNTVIWEVRQY